MPKPRNYWVLRGARGTIARDRLLAYYAEPKEVNVGGGTPQPDKVRLYIQPFSLPLATGSIMRDTALSTSWDALRSVGPTAQYVSDTFGARRPVNVRSYKAPRIQRIELDRTGTAARSQITNLPYMKYDNVSRSIPFGKNVDTDTLAEVAGELIGAYTTTLGFSARLIPERA